MAIFMVIFHFTFMFIDNDSGLYSEIKWKAVDIRHKSIRIFKK